MSEVYGKPVTIQVQDQETEVWADVFGHPLHASVNKETYKQGLSFQGDADQYHARLLFKFRHIGALEELRHKPQLYRLIYRGHTYHVADYDDYMEQHRTVKITGVLYE